jgi:DNA-binding transcriptional LysR family regulator
MPTITSTDITLVQLRALVAVVDHGGFTAAARHLRITQSGISQALATLESTLDVPLVTRDRTGVSVTHVGETILTHARAALAEIESIRQHAAQAAGLECGTVRIASVGSAAARLLPPVLRTFRRRHPAIDVVLLEGTDQEVIAWIRSRVADVGFAGAGAADVTGLTTDVVVEDELLLIVPAAHRLAHRERVRLTELRDEPFLMSAGGCEPIIRAAADRARVELSVRMVVRDIGALIALVNEGCGVTLLPELAASVRGRVRVVRLEPSVRRQLLMLTHGAATPATQAFLDEFRRR